MVEASNKDEQGPLKLLAATLRLTMSCVVESLNWTWPKVTFEGWHVLSQGVE